MVTEAVALGIGGAFLSSFLNVLFDRVATVHVLKSLFNVFTKEKLRDDLLQKLEMLMLTVDKVLADAEEKQIINSSVQRWLDILKDAVYDVEDLLDSIQIEGPAQEEHIKAFNARLENICSITEFPDSICDSKQLRYLDLSGAAFDCLPERLGKLCSLETLKLSGCCHLNQLSANLSNLSKLVHLDISGTPIL
ncbi:hypothetical protein V6N11_063573 [Hibiscus sabdariffa]|uniref:Uncharacterized protein n=2 Tax=Hibiscus sabdariffa TaxID=183260 RepID=A0ABR2BF17_9ROSI